METMTMCDSQEKLGQLEFELGKLPLAYPITKVVSSVQRLIKSHRKLIDRQHQLESELEALKVLIQIF